MRVQYPKCAYGPYGYFNPIKMVYTSKQKSLFIFYAKKYLFRTLSPLGHNVFHIFFLTKSEIDVM